MRSSKHSARARRRHGCSDYPGEFMNELERLSLGHSEVHTGNKPVQPVGSVYVRINTYSTGAKSDRDRSDYYYFFANEEAARRAVDSACMASS